MGTAAVIEPSGSLPSHCFEERILATSFVLVTKTLFLLSQMQVVTELKTEQDPNCSEPDVEGVSPPPVGSQTPMDADKQAIYR